MSAWAVQGSLAALSLLATYLSLHRSVSWRRFACVPGVLVQPLWMYCTLSAHQFGMFALCFVYGGLYLINGYDHWIRRK